MPEAALRTESDQGLEVFDHQSAARKLQDVLSLRSPSFYRCAFRLLGNAADAEDAVQEALLAAYKHINQFRGQSQISTWLTAIVRNCALMQLRKRSRQIISHWTSSPERNNRARYGKHSRTSGP